jgi:hypothetical protein
MPLPEICGYIPVARYLRNALQGIKPNKVNTSSSSGSHKKSKDIYDDDFYEHKREIITNRLDD